FGSESDWQAQQKRREITLQQARTVVREFTMARSAAPVVTSMQPISYKNSDATGVSVFATTDPYIVVAAFAMAEGRFMTELESEAGRPVCVLGNNIATKLFEHESPIGRRIRLGPNSLEVIGVIEKQGSFLGLTGLDDRVLI